MSVFVFLRYFILAIIILEIWYSFYKKDKRHTKRTTLNNVLNGLAVYVFSKKVLLFYFLFIFSLFPINQIEPPHPFFSLLFCLIIMDFMMYLLHKSKHSIPFLWEFHKYHHSDKKINTTTTFRVSLVEQLYVYLFLTPILLIGFPVTTTLLAFVILSVYQIYAHNTYIGMPRFLEKVFVSPHLHKIHHDKRAEFQQSNYGAMFSFWDKLFDTSTQNIENLSIGLEGEDEDNFIKNQIKPIKMLYKKYA